MYDINDIKVTLLNPEDVKNFIKNHGVIACVCYNTNEKFAERVGLSCLKAGHTSGSRGDYFKFEIECPRYTADQIVRHEQGVFKNMQSQRYVNMSDMEVYIPPEIEESHPLKTMYEIHERNCKEMYNIMLRQLEHEGITGEKAHDLIRGLLPIGVKTKLRIGFDIEGLIHFMHKRLCLRADKPIRVVAQLMKEEVLKVEPRYKEFLVPQCKHLLYCPEKHGCGMYKDREFAKNAINMYKEYLNMLNEGKEE